MSDAGDPDVIIEHYDVSVEPDELLITLVKNYPPLYNKRSADYTNAQTKQKIWNEIADTLQITASKVKNKWLRIREKYSRERKLTENSRSKYQSKWPLYNKLKFLNDHVKRRRIRSHLVSSSKAIQYRSRSTSRSSSYCETNLDPALSELSENKVVISTNNSQNDEFDVGSDQSELTEVNDTHMGELINGSLKRKKKDLLSSQISSVNDALHAILREHNNKPKNADEIFAALVIAELEKMPEDIKRVRKCEISEILFKPFS